LTSISGHKTADSVWRDCTGGQEIQCPPFWARTHRSGMRGRESFT